MLSDAAIAALAIAFLSVIPVGNLLGLLSLFFAIHNLTRLPLPSQKVARNPTPQPAFI